MFILVITVLFYVEYIDAMIKEWRNIGSNSDGCK